MSNQAAVIESLLAGSGVKYSTNRRSFILSCPHCGKRDKLYVQRDNGRFICWVCGDDFRGRFEYLMAEISPMSVGEIKSKLYGNIFDASKNGMALNLKLEDWFDEEPIPDAAQSVFLPISPSLDFVDLNHKSAAKGVEYLEKRGISVELAQKYQIMYHPVERRIIFPVISDGQWYGWQGRTIGPSEWIDEESGEIVRVPKSLTSYGFKKDQFLMFADTVKGQDHVVLTEGPVDAIKCDSVGGNVCTMGKAVSQRQLQLIRESGVGKLYLGLDRDAAKEIKKIVKQMSEYMDIYDMRAPRQFEDLGEMTPEQTKQLFDSAKRLDKTSLIMYLKDFYD